MKSPCVHVLIVNCLEEASSGQTECPILSLPHRIWEPRAEGVCNTLPSQRRFQVEEDKCHGWSIFLTKWQCLHNVSESLMTLSVSWNKEVSGTGWKCYRRQGRNTKDRWQGDKLNTIHGIRTVKSLLRSTPTNTCPFVNTEKGAPAVTPYAPWGGKSGGVCWLLGRFHWTVPRPLSFCLLCFPLPTPNPGYLSLPALPHFSFYFWTHKSQRS